MTEMLFRGAGNPQGVQAEIELKALPVAERALTVAADLLSAALDAPQGQRQAMVLEALRVVHRRAVLDARREGAK